MLKINIPCAELLAAGAAINHTYIGQIMTDFAKEIAKKTDDIIKDTLIKKGFPADEEFIKEHVSCIVYECEDFNHIWYHFGQPDAIRIISIERNPNTSLFDTVDPCKMKWELRYY